MNFAGFDRNAIALLATLPALERPAYDELRGTLVSGLLTPAAALIEQVVQLLGVPLTVKAGSSISPLHTDLRFAAPGAPRYKDHLLMTVWHGLDKKTGPTLWIRVDTGGVGFASGTLFSPAARQRWRDAVAGPAGAELAGTIAELTQRHRADNFDVAGELLKKVPSPWATNHPRADLLRRTGFQLRFSQALPSLIDSPAFAPWCVDRLRELLPVHQWLVREIYRETDAT